MSEETNKWFKLFGFKIWELNIKTTTTPERIETNVTDDSIRLLKKMTKEGYDSINEIKASTRLGGA